MSDSQTEVERSRDRKMNRVLDKLRVCVRRTQEGKTFIAVKNIKQELEQDSIDGNSVHVVFTMNTLKSKDQFVKRLRKIEDTYGEGSIVELASKPSGIFKHVSNVLELQGLYLNPNTCPKIVVMCSNETRFHDGIEFVNALNGSPIIKRVFVYYDEIHKYINETLRDQIERLSSMNTVQKIIGFTATPFSLFYYWKLLHILEISDVTNKNYVGSDDMDFIIVDGVFPNPYPRMGPFDFDRMDSETLNFINTVLDKFPTIITEESARVFIPAHIRRKSHEAVRNLSFQRNPNAVVVTINGEGGKFEYQLQDDVVYCRSLSIPDISKTLPSGFNEMSYHQREIEIQKMKSEELCETIARLLKELNLTKRPLIVTGYLCVGMGQTLIHKDIGHFTSAIIGHMDLFNDDLYQLFGRLTGNYRDWESFSVKGSTRVYCCSTVRNRIIDMESCVYELAKEALEDEAVTVDDYTRHSEKTDLTNFSLPKKSKKRREVPKTKKPTPDQIGHEVFDTLEEAKMWRQCVFNQKTQTRDTNAPQTLRKNDTNPTLQYLLKRFYGINEKNNHRMIPLNTGQWCIYWRKDALNKEVLERIASTPKRSR